MTHTSNLMKYLLKKYLKINEFLAIPVNADVNFNHEAKNQVTNSEKGKKNIVNILEMVFFPFCTINPTGSVISKC